MSRKDKYEHPIGVLLNLENGRRIAGQLKLKRGELLDCNVVSIVDNELFIVTEGGSLQGISKAGKVSLLDCVQGGMSSVTSSGDFEIHHGDISFRYVLFGKQHVALDRECICVVTCKHSRFDLQSSAISGPNYLRLSMG